METSAQVPVPRTLKTRAMGRKKLPVPAELSVPKDRRIANARFRRLRVAGKYIGAWAVMVVGGLAVPWSAAPFTIAGMFFALAGWTVVSVRRFNKRNAAGLELLKSGQPTEARAIFEGLTKNAGRQRVVAVYNTAIALLAEGKVGEALAHFVEAQATLVPQIHAPSTSHLALCYGLLGDVGAAEAWLTEFDARTKSPNRAHVRFVKATAQAVSLLRAGRNAEAMLVLDDNGRAVTGLLASILPGLSETVWAYALEVNGRRDDKRFVALAAEIEAGANLERLRRTFDGWPEVRSFLAGLNEDGATA